MTFPRICWTAVPASFPQIHERCWCRTGISTASCLRHLSPCVSVFVYCKCRFMLQRGSSIQNVRKNNLHPPLLQLILWSRCGIVLYLSLLLSSQQKYSIFLIKYDFLMHHIFWWHEDETPISYAPAPDICFFGPGSRSKISATAYFIGP